MADDWDYVDETTAQTPSPQLSEQQTDDWDYEQAPPSEQGVPTIESPMYKPGLAEAAELSAWAGSATAGVFASPWYATFKAIGDERGIESWSDHYMQLMADWTYTPRTPGAKAMVEGAETIMHKWHEWVMENVGDPIYERGIKDKFIEKGIHEPFEKEMSLSAPDDDGMIHPAADDLGDLGEDGSNIGELLQDAPEAIAAGAVALMETIPYILAPELGRKAMTNKAKVETADMMNRYKVLGREERPFDAAKRDWFEGELASGPKGYAKVDWTPRYKDLPYRNTGVIDPEVVLPGKFVAQKSPVAKWGVDLIDKERLSSELIVEDILYHPTHAYKRNRPVNVPTQKGALTKWSELNTEQRALISIAAERYNQPMPNGAPRAAEVAPAILQNLRFKKVGNSYQIHPNGDIKMSADAMKAYYNMRGGLERARNFINKMSAEFKPGEGIEVMASPGYFPHVFDAPVKVWIGKGKGAQRYKGFQTKWAAERFAKKMRGRLGSEYKVTVSDTQFTTVRDTAVKSFLEASNYLKAKGRDKEAAIIDKAMKETAEVKGFKGHAGARIQHTRGWLGDPTTTKSAKQLAKDFEKSYQMYVEGAVRTAVGFRMEKRLQALMEDNLVKRYYPNSRTFIEQYKDQALGRRSKGNDWMQGVEYVLRETGIAKGLDVASTATLYSKLFLHRLSFLVPNATQPLQVVPAQLLRLKGLGIDGDVGMAIAKSFAQLASPTAESKLAGAAFLRERLIEPKFLEQFSSRDFLKSPEHRRKLLLDVATGRLEAAVVEEFARYQAGLMYYNFFRSAGISAKKAAPDAAYLANRTMVEYHMGEKARLYQTPVTRHAGQFKTFQSNYLGQAMEHLRHAKQTGDIAPAMAFIGTQVFFAGVTGMIGMETADNLFELGGAKTLPSEFVLRHAPDWAAFGVPAGMTGVVSSTYVAPQLNVRDLFSFPQLEYAGQIVAGVSNLITKKLSGTATPYDVERMLLAASPPHVKGLIEHAFEKGKLAHDPDLEAPLKDMDKGIGQYIMKPSDNPILIHDPKTGKGITRRDFGDYMARIAGARSTDEYRAMKAMFQLTRLKERDRLDKAALAEYAAQVYLNGWPVNTAFIKDEAIRLRYTGAEFNKAVFDAAKKMSTDVLQRAIDIKTKTGRDSYSALLDMIPNLHEQLGKGVVKSPEDDWDYAE